MAAFSDDFNRANSGTVGGGWTEFNEAGLGIGISGNLLDCTGDFFSGGAGEVAWGTPCDSNNMYSQIEMGPNAQGAISVSVRVSSSSNNEGVKLYYELTNGNWSIISRTSGGTPTTRASGSGLSYAAGLVLRIEAVGNVYTAKYNGSTLGTWPDTGGVHAIDSSHRQLSASVANTGGGFARCNAENWAGGDLSSGGFFALF